MIDDSGIWYEAGTWAKQWKEESSNFREADNLVRRIESLVKTNKIHGREIFLFTDNLVFESCYYKGYSNAEKLADIILRLHQAERDGDLILHVIHVAGTRMKAWGIDGLSRGDNLDGMFGGKDPLSFIPLDKGADQRADGKIKRWIDSWWKIPETGQPWCGEPLHKLSKEDMFDLQQVEGPRLWMPPPAAMETVMELFNEDRIAHPWNPHVFVVPRLMTHLWRKALGRDWDVAFTVAPGVDFWDSSQHEPLIVALVFPLCHVRNYRGPWTVRDTSRAGELGAELTTGFKLHSRRFPRKLSDVEGKLREVWRDPPGRSRFVLQQFLSETRRFPPVQECLVRRMLSRSRKRPFPQTGGSGGQGRGRPDSGRDGRTALSTCKKRRSSHGGSFRV